MGKFPASSTPGVSSGRREDPRGGSSDELEALNLSALAAAAGELISLHIGLECSRAVPETRTLIS